MNNPSLLFNNEVVAAAVGAILAFVLGIFASFLTQLWFERRQKPQITFERVVEEPLSIAKDELKEKLSIRYLHNDVKSLYSFSLRIANTGKGTIRGQVFTCLFAKGTHLIDSAFPRITTVPQREVGPVVLDPNNSNNNEWRFTIETLGEKQVVNIDFLTIDNEGHQFDVIFRPNLEKEVVFTEGSVSEAPTIEHHFYNVALGIFVAFVLAPAFNIIPIIGQLFSAIFTLPFALVAYRSLRPVVSHIIKLLERNSSRTDYQISGDIRGLAIGNNNEVYVDQIEHIPDKSN